MGWSPAVGVYGLRQVGKTTLAEAVTALKKGVYETLDTGSVFLASQNRPVEFCTRAQLLCVDEAQKNPSLFPVIKNLIGTRRKPGQFLLTGSIRFTLKKEIREALTGRILLFELLPFTLAESEHKEPSPFLQICFDFLQRWAAKTNPLESVLKKLENSHNARNFNLKHVARYTTLGGMPIPCFSRDPAVRKLWYESFFETLITRDLALVDEGLSDVGLARGLSFLRALAFMQGQEWNTSSLAHSSALSLVKAKKMLSALEALCLIDLVVPESHAKRSQRKVRVEWKDVGLWNYFCQTSAERLQDQLVLMNLVISQELRFQLGLLDKATSWTHYKSHNGANVPWIFRQGDRALALIYTPDEAPTRYQYRDLRQFIQREPKDLGIILGPEKTSFTVLDDRILLMPFTAIL